MDKLLGLATVILCMHQACAFINGVAHANCGSMDMSSDALGAAKQTSGSPYTLTIMEGATVYKSKSIIKVQIVGPKYSGIILQARRVGTTAYHTLGNFAIPNSGIGVREMTCITRCDTITHTASHIVNSESTRFGWVAPRVNEGAIEFLASVLQEGNKWYTIKSSSLPWSA